MELNPLKEASAWSGESDKGGDAGLKLWVRGDHSGGFVSGAEMASVRDDALYGSFRVGMKLAAESGTCGAFFWVCIEASTRQRRELYVTQNEDRTNVLGQYFDNTQEIDMEFLSKDFNASRGAVNLVLQSHEAESHGNDASNTSTYKIQPLQFRPDNAFHEYRFDWTPDRVTFFVDGSPVQTFTENVPTSGGTFFMNHWSNGDKGWSAGPPGNDTAMTVSYVKAYFNSTDTERQGKFEKRCKEWDPEKVCAIPEQKGMPDGEVGAQTYFFSEDGGDKTPGQIVFKHSNGAAGMCASSPLALCVSMVVALLTALVL